MIRTILNKLKPLLPSFLVDYAQNTAKIDFPVSSTCDGVSVKPESFTFVLLQYNHAELTAECVRHIQKLDAYIPVSIVVVDNGSSEKALDATRALCGSTPFITLIESKENLGFARGNNMGYRFARGQSSKQLICVMNNDVFITDKKFIKKSVRIYSRHRFSILGPDVIVPQKRPLHQNPFRYHLRTRDEMSDFITNNERKSTQVRDKKCTIEPPSPLGRSIKDIHRREGNIVLHGSIVIVSPDFIRDFDNIFDERTFLYGEEDILALRALSRGHRIVYDPSIRVFHHTQASTDTKNLENYYLFRYRSSIDSAKIYISLWDEITGTMGQA